MTFKLTDEQWNEIKVELIDSAKDAFRDIAYEIMEQEADFEELTKEFIQWKIDCLRDDKLFDRLTNEIIKLYR